MVEDVVDALLGKLHWLGVVSPTKDQEGVTPAAAESTTPGMGTTSGIRVLRARRGDGFERSQNVVPASSSLSPPDEDSPASEKWRAGIPSYSSSRSEHPADAEVSPNGPPADAEGTP